MTATQYLEGVLVEWRVSYAPDNAGFHVYRGDVRVTPDLVAGWAWSAKGFSADRRYAWLDPEGSGIDTYRIVAVDGDGRETECGPVGVEPAKTAYVPRRMAVLLSELGLTSSETSWSPSPADIGDARKARAVRGKRPADFAERLAALAALAGTQSRSQPIEPSSAPQEGAWLLAEMPAVKLAVREEGWYRVEQPALVAAGLPRRVRPSSLRLYTEGVEVPLSVASVVGSRAGSDYAIEFYGLPLDTPWSGTRVYWLVADGADGARIEKCNAPPIRAAMPASFAYTIEFAQRSVYFATLRNGDAENFFGPVVTERGLDVYLQSVQVDGSAHAEPILEVVLQGGFPGRHDVIVRFNGLDAGRVEFDGTAAGAEVVALPPSALLEGDNQVSLVAQGTNPDVSLVSRIRLTYARLYRAVDDQLRCTVEGRVLTKVGGFDTGRVRAIDITNPGAPVELKTWVRRQGATFSAFFSAGRPGTRTVLVFGESAVKRPVSVTANVPSQLRLMTGAEYVILTHGDFAASVAPLAALREGQGWSVALVDVQDVFDELNYGHPSPYALKAFLAAAARQWATPPSHALLCGDASFDPRNHMGLGYFDFVPTKLVDAASMEAASDDWFADLNDDGLPELAVGRFPVRTPAECAAIVAKLIVRQNVRQTNSVLLCADAPMGGVDFSGANAALQALVPAPFEVQTIVRADGDGGAARSELLVRWAQGPRFVNYYGWSFANFWRENLLAGTDVPGLGNGSALPVVAGVCNLNCYFHDLFIEGLGETLLKASSGGAAAVWGCSDFVTPATLGPMNEEFVRRLFDGGGLTVGQVAMQAKGKIASLDARRTWLLLGDPTMEP